MSTEGFRDCKQTLWSLFQSYAFVETNLSAAHAPSKDDAVKVVREPEFRSIMGAFARRQNFHRFFLAQSNHLSLETGSGFGGMAGTQEDDGDDALCVERALSKLSDEATLDHLWAAMATARARLRKRRACGSAGAKSSAMDAAAENDNLALFFPRWKELAHGRGADDRAVGMDMEVSPSVTVNWDILSSVLYLYMHDTLRLSAVDRATLRKARATLHMSPPAQDDPNWLLSGRATAEPAVRMSIAVDPDSYRSADSAVPVDRRAQPLAQPSQLHKKLDRTPLEALYRLRSSRNGEASCRNASPRAVDTPRGPLAESREGSEEKGRGTIEIPVEDEDAEEGEEVPLHRREPHVTDHHVGWTSSPRAHSPCVTTAPAAAADHVTSPNTAAAAGAGATPLKTKPQRQEEFLRRMATPKRTRDAKGSSAATTPVRSPRRHVTPPKRSGERGTPRTPHSPPPQLPSPSKLCQLTGAGLGDGAPAELAKPTPPPQRKRTQKEAAAASALRRHREAAVVDAGHATEGLSRQMHFPPPVERSPSPAFPSVIPGDRVETAVASCPAPLDTFGSGSPSPREPLASDPPRKHLAYIQPKAKPTTTSGSGGLQQRAPSAANQHPVKAPFVIRTRGRVGAPTSRQHLAARMPETAEGHRKEPQPPHSPILPSDNDSDVRATPASPPAEPENEGRRTTALPVEASDVGAQRFPGDGPGDFDADALTEKPATRSDDGQGTRAENDATEPLSPLRGQDEAPHSPQMPPTAISRARRDIASFPEGHHPHPQGQRQDHAAPPPRVATAPSISMTPCEVGDDRHTDLDGPQLPPPTTRESPILRCTGVPMTAVENSSECAENREGNRDLPPRPQPSPTADHVVRGRRRQPSPPAADPPAVTAGGEPMTADTPASPYAEPPNLRPTMFLRATPFSVHRSRVDETRVRLRTPPRALEDMDMDMDMDNTAENARDCTPPKQRLSRHTDPCTTNGSGQCLFTIPTAADDAAAAAVPCFYNLHNRTAAALRTPPKALPIPDGGASPSSLHSSPQKLTASPLRSFRGLLPPQAHGSCGSSATPGSVSAGAPATATATTAGLATTPLSSPAPASSPPPRRLSARARRLSRSASRGSLRHLGTGETGSGHGGEMPTPPRVPQTRCRSSSMLTGRPGEEVSLQVSVLVSPRRTCGAEGGLLATALAATPDASTPPASATGRRVRLTRLTSPAQHA